MDSSAHLKVLFRRVFAQTKLSTVIRPHVYTIDSTSHSLCNSFRRGIVVFHSGGKVCRSVAAFAQTTKSSFTALYKHSRHCFQPDILIGWIFSTLKCFQPHSAAVRIPRPVYLFTFLASKIKTPNTGPRKKTRRRVRLLAPRCCVKSLYAAT